MSHSTTPLGERRTIAGAGIDLSVSVSGNGPLVILMHGWPEQSLVVATPGARSRRVPAIAWPCPTCAAMA